LKIFSRDNKNLTAFASLMMSFGWSAGDVVAGVKAICEDWEGFEGQRGVQE
jgi:hypothetical protein